MLCCSFKVLESSPPTFVIKLRLNVSEAFVPDDQYFKVYGPMAFRLLRFYHNASRITLSLFPNFFFTI